MNKNILSLLQKSGFCFWEEEHWNPGGIIDWASQYDEELQTFIKLLVLECIDIAEKNPDNISESISSKLL